MTTPTFVLRLENTKECICTKCFRTVRVTREEPTLEQAQEQHHCVGFDLRALIDDEFRQAE